MAEHQPEPWLRGTLAELPAEQRAVLHALELAGEDMERWCVPLTEQEFSARPHNLPPVAFHLRHIVGSLNRLLTYAEGGMLNDEQLRTMKQELDAPAAKESAMTFFRAGLASAAKRIRAFTPQQWQEPRGVGRKQLPATVGGLLVHCAEHTQRHTGQAVTTAKVLMALRKSPSV